MIHVFSQKKAIRISGQALRHGCLSVAVLVLLIPNQINSQDHDRSDNGLMTYDSVEHIVLNLEAEKKYEEARSLLLEHMADYPEKWYEISKEMIYLNSKTNRYEENLEIFKEGHERSYFYFLHPQFKSCEPYKGYKGFTPVVRRDQELRQNAISNSQAFFEVVLPEGYDSKNNYPAVVVLHGGGSSILRAKKHWRSSVLNKKFIVVFIQSYLYYSYNTFGWKKYDLRAREEVKRCYKEVLDAYPVKTDDVTVCGISAGATMALDLFVNKVINFKAAMAFSPARPQEFFNGDQKAEGFEDKMVVMLIGENDSETRRADLTEMADIFTQKGIGSFVTFIPDTGHEYPLDFAYWINSGLEIIYPELSE